ncbi:MAG: hypothetical protein RR967_06475 [Anaerovoracaceae bacterium]
MKKKILAIGIVATMVLSVPTGALASTSSQKSGYEDGIFKGYAYGKVAEKTRSAIEVKHGKIVDVYVEHFADDRAIQGKITPEFFQSLKDYGPEYIANVIYQMGEYPEFIAEKGQGGYKEEAAKLLGQELADGLEAHVKKEGFSFAKIKKYIKDNYIRDKWEEVDSISGATMASTAIAEGALMAVNKSKEAYAKAPSPIVPGKDYSASTVKKVPAKLYPGAVVTYPERLGAYVTTEGRGMTIEIGGANNVTSEELGAYLSQIKDSKAKIFVNNKEVPYTATGNLSQLSIKLEGAGFAQETIGEFTDKHKWVDLKISVDGYRDIDDRQILVFDKSHPADYFNYNKLNGANNVNVDSEGNVSGFVEISIPKELPALFNKNVIKQISHDLDHHYIVSKKLPQGVKMDINEGDISADGKTLKINLKGNNKDLVKNKTNIRFGINERLIDGLLVDSVSDIAKSFYLNTDIGGLKGNENNPLRFYDAKNALGVNLSNVPVGFVKGDTVPKVTLGESKWNMDWSAGENGKINILMADGSTKSISDRLFESSLEISKADGEDIDFDNVPAEGIAGKLVYADYTYKFKLDVIFVK